MPAVSTSYLVKELAIDLTGFQEKNLINFSYTGPTFLLVHESEHHVQSIQSHPTPSVF